MVLRVSIPLSRSLSASTLASRLRVRAENIRLGVSVQAVVERRQFLALADPVVQRPLKTLVIAAVASGNHLDDTDRRRRRPETHHQIDRGIISEEACISSETKLSTAEQFQATCGVKAGHLRGGRRRSGSSAATEGLLEPVAVTVHGQHVDVMGQPVEQRAGGPLGPQDRRPVVKGQVRSDDGGATLVTLREHRTGVRRPFGDKGTGPSSSTMSSFTALQFARRGFKSRLSPRASMS